MLVSFVVSLAVYLRRKCAIRRTYVEDAVPEAVTTPYKHSRVPQSIKILTNSLPPSEWNFRWSLRVHNMTLGEFTQVLTDPTSETTEISSGGGFGNYVDKESINVSGRMRMSGDGFTFT